MMAEPNRPNSASSTRISTVGPSLSVGGTFQTKTGGVTGCDVLRARVIAVDEKERVLGKQTAKQFACLEAPLPCLVLSD